jgi:hypothetical protein
VCAVGHAVSQLRLVDLGPSIMTTSCSRMGMWEDRRRFIAAFFA